MVRCKKCGKKFQTIQALNDHYRAMHPNERVVVPAQSATRKLAGVIIIIIILVGALVGYLIFLQLNQPNSTQSSELALLGQTISPSLSSSLSGVSFSTLSAIGKGSATAPSTVTGSPLVFNGKPGILYIGGDFCPFCAAERWAMIVALSKFGNFTNLVYMVSSSNDNPSSIATFSFSYMNYSSQYVSFVAVEEYDRNHNVIKTLSTDQGNLMGHYDSSLSIPFVDFGNQYVQNGAQFQPSPVLSNLNWTQISTKLNNVSSPIAQAIDGAANSLITAICHIDGGNPSSICNQSFASVSFNTTNQTHSIQTLFDSMFQINKRN
jgi:hypothetical protein